jgi:hypothetical protein
VEALSAPPLASPVVAVLGLVVASCGPAGFPATAPAPELPDAEAIVYLIGDAGLATTETPNILQLKREVAERSKRSDVVVAFLGDNVYERGLHEPTHPDYAQDAARLEAQIDIVRGTSARAVFLPGNHDWGYGGARGRAQIRRQADYIRAAAAKGADLALLPPAGCPGPETVPVARSVLLVLIETDLWLQDEAPGESCRSASTDEALRSLTAALRENRDGENRYVVVLGHHPLKTYGPHGGYFGLKDQFFPGTNIWGPLYVPIPFLYPIVRNSGVSVQDISSSRNTQMREQLAGVFREFPGQPLVYAAGHDHNLQVFRGGDLGVGYILVSGAGSKLTDVGKDDAIFAVGRQHRELGYMRLEFLKDGRVLLSVVTDGTAGCRTPSGCPGRPTVRYWRWLAGN